MADAQGTPGPDGGDDVLTAIVREWARVRIQKLDILNQNGANLVYNHGCHTANLLKLTEQQKLGVTPFPCPTNTTVIAGAEQPRPAPVQLPSGETQSAAPAAPVAEPGGLVQAIKSKLPWLLLGGAIGATPAAYLAGKVNVAPPSPTPITAPAVPGGGKVGLEVEGLQWQK